MSLVLRINPAGIDEPIARLQKKIFSSLSLKWGLAGTRFNCHPRCYRNQTETGYVAELYMGGNEYNETYLNDFVDVTSFFGMDTTEQVAEDNIMTANLHLIFFVDLSKIKPGADRNDEEARNDVQKVIDTFGTSYGFSLTKTSVGIDLCLKEYPGTKKEAGLKYRDMHPFHVFRFDMQVFYQPTQTKC